jgi:hypothetical protein
VDNGCRLRDVGLEPLIGEAIDTAAIVAQWPELMRLKVSIEAGVAGEVIELFGSSESNNQSCASHQPALLRRLLAKLSVGSRLLRKRGRLYQLNGNNPFYSTLPHFGLKKTSTTRFVRRIHISNMTHLVNLSTDGGVRRK